MAFDKWVYVCQGKPREGASKAETENGLHVWKRREDRTAFCKRCALELTVEEANDCFRQW